MPVDVAQSAVPFEPNRFRSTVAHYAAHRFSELIELSGPVATRPA